MDTQDAQYLRVTLAAVEEFSEAFEAVMELAVENDGAIGRGVLPAAYPRDDADPQEFLKRTQRASRAAGRAGNATSIVGGHYQVSGVGRVDPIAAWNSMLTPKPVLEPSNIRDAIQMIAGQLEARIAQADAKGPTPLGVEGLHQLVWSAAAPLWRSGHYRHAVHTAAETVVTQVKARSGRNDAGETDLWRQLFNAADPKLGAPRLRWPGEPRDRNVSTINNGLSDFSAGVQMVIRNPAAHLLEEYSPQKALEHLAVLSVLATYVDACELAKYEEDQEVVVDRAAPSK